MMAILIGSKRGHLSNEEFQLLIKELNMIPEKIERILGFNEEFKHIASLYKDANNFLYLGRGYFFPVALEGARKDIQRQK